jgi:hypothetical protein
VLVWLGERLWEIVCLLVCVCLCVCARVCVCVWVHAHTRVGEQAGREGKVCLVGWLVGWLVGQVDVDVDVDVDAEWRGCGVVVVVGRKGGRRLDSLEGRKGARSLLSFLPNRSSASDGVL